MESLESKIKAIKEQAEIKSAEWGVLKVVSLDMLNNYIDWSVEATLTAVIKLSDEIENQHPDTGFSEWKAFKHFRNTLRDLKS